MWFLIFLACGTKPISVQPTQEETLAPIKGRTLYPQLQEKLSTWSSQGKPNTITPEREQVMNDLASWIRERQQKKEPTELIFVCTHNSRRSHMSQLWAQAAAEYLNIGNVQTYSGGTEATAFNPRSVRALSTHGFVITDTQERSKNPIYETKIGEKNTSILSFSKKFGHEYNPKENFAAIMVCSDADSKCPFVPGAQTRVSLPYIDPKIADNTPQETETYLAKSDEIGREMLWLMSLVQQSY